MFKNLIRMNYDLGLAIGVAQSILDPVLQGVQNRANRRFTEKMYNRQRQDSLADWNMQNEYNSPTSQMARLKSAGLNPNLVYGNGVSGASGASSPVRSSQASATEGSAPKLNALANYYDIQLRQAQIDNVKSATTVNQQEAALKAVQTETTRAQGDVNAATAYSKQLMNFITEKTQDTQIDMKKQQLQQMVANTQMTLNEDERRTAMNEQNVALAAEKILQARAQTATTQAQKDEIQQRIINLKNAATLQQLDINLKKMGVQPHDELWQRILAQLVGANLNP